MKQFHFEDLLKISSDTEVKVRLHDKLDVTVSLDEVDKDYYKVEIFTTKHVLLQCAPIDVRRLQHIITELRTDKPLADYTFVKDDTFSIEDRYVSVWTIAYPLLFIIAFILGLTTDWWRPLLG